MFILVRQKEVIYMTTIKAKAFFIVPEGVMPPEDSIIKWRDMLKNTATLINDRRQRKIKDEYDYQTKLAQPSAQEYKSISDALTASGFESKHGKSGKEIGDMQEKNAMNSYEKYDAKLAYQFETVDGVEAKRFKEAVDTGTDLWAERVNKTTMRFTGDRIRAFGIGPLAGYFLTGDKRAVGMLREGDQITEGGPVNVARFGLRTALKAGLIQKLTQAGVLILASNFDPITILAQNTIINDFISGLQKAAYVAFQPTVDLTKSYCLFIRDGATLKLEIQVVAP
jgi:hypothetical protein